MTNNLSLINRVVSRQKTQRVNIGRHFPGKPRISKVEMQAEILPVHEAGVCGARLMDQHDWRKFVGMWS